MHLTIKEKVALYTEGLALYARRMNSPETSQPARKWREWRDQHPTYIMDWIEAEWASLCTRL